MLYLLVAAAAAAPTPIAAAVPGPGGHAPTTRLSASAHDALLTRFRAFTSPDHQAELAAVGHGDCLTELMLDLEAHWGLFTDAERAEITHALAPEKHDLFAPLAARMAPPPPDGTDSCVGQQRANRVVGDHFVVEWDSGIDEGQANDFLDALEYAYDVEIDELGWRAPDGDTRYLMPAYVQAGNYAGAYTTVRSCGGFQTPYIVAYAGSFSAGNWYETMALHEFNHASQFGYGYAFEFFWWEATATYIEEQVLPNSNWWSTYVVGYTDNPQMAMAAFSQSDQDVFYHMYGMAIWGFYLDEHQGGADLVRQTWEEASRQGGQYSYTQEDVLTDLGYDYDAAYADFVARNAALDYREHRYMRAVDQVESINSLPANGASESRTAPQGYGQNYIRFNSSAGDGDSTLVVHFHGGGSVPWLAELAEVNGNSVVRAVVGDIGARTGEGDVRIDHFGDNDVILIVSPLQDDDNDYTYTWEAELIPATEDTGGGNGGEDTGEGGNGGGDGDGGGNGGDTGEVKVSLPGCGCASGGGALPSLAGVALGLAVLAGRRRPAPS